MKILALALLCTTSLSLAQPALPIEKAVKIANDWLKEAGQKDSNFIAGISLDPTALTRREFVWAVRWNSPIQLEETKRETGIEIAMDGTVARYVDKTTPAQTNTPGTVGVPAERAELLNTKNRTKRPSILDLKR
jgi:hypothetical protein